MAKNTDVHATNIAPKGIEISEYPHLELEKFRTFTEELSSIGFEHLIDFMDEKDSQEFVCRLMVERERKTYACMRQPRFGEETNCVLSIISHFQDGRALVSTAGDVEFPQRSDVQTRVEQFEPGISAEQAYRTHLRQRTMLEWGQNRESGLMNYFIYYSVPSWPGK